MSDNVLEFNWIIESQLEVGADTWKNSIGIKAHSGTETPPGPTDAIIAAWEGFMIAVHYSDVTYNQTTLRECVQHKGPTPGTEIPPIWQHSVGTAGEGDTTYGGAHNANYLPKSAVLFCHKNTSGGRKGKVFLRNILTEVDVSSPLSGDWQFTGGAGHFQQSVFDAAAVAFLADFIGDPPTTGNYFFVVHHLLKVASTDTRDPTATIMSSLTSAAPRWNKAKR